MIKIEIENSYSKIFGLSVQETNNLNQILSYKKPGSDFIQNPFISKYNFLLSKGISPSFPTGLLYLVEEFLKNNNLLYSKEFLHTQPESKKTYRFLSSIPTTRYYQNETIDACIEKHRGIVESATGTGKTLMINLLIKKLSLPTLVIVPSIGILYQFHENLIKMFGKKMVGIIGDGKKEYNCDITISTIQSLNTVPDSFWKKIDVVIIDEFHHASSESFQKLNKTQFKNIYYRFGFTGTNFRNDGTDLALKGVLSNLIYSYSAVQAIKDGFLCKPVFLLNKIKHTRGFCINDANPKDLDGFGRLKKFSKLKYSKKEYDECIVDNEDYNQKIADTVNKMIDENKSTIVFVKRIEHGETLLKLIPRASLMTGGPKGRINEDMLAEFNSGSIPCIIGTSVIGEGVDTIRASVGVMAGSGAAESDVIQKIGRLLRPHESKSMALIIDYIHESTMWQIKQSNERIDIYNKYESDVIIM